MRSGKVRTYLDSCVIIDYVKNECGVHLCEDRTRELEYLEKLFESAKAGQTKLFTSSVTIFECLHIGNNHEVPEEAKRLFTSITGSGRVVIPVSLTPVMSEIARQLYWDGVPLPRKNDRLHVATATEIGCSEFVTFDGLDGDDRIMYLCQQYGLSVVYPSETNVAQQEYHSWVSEKKESERRQIEAKEKKAKGQLSLY